MREKKFKAYWNDSNYTGWSVPFTLLDIKDGQVFIARDYEGADREPLSHAVAIVDHIGCQDKNGKDIYEGDILNILTEGYAPYPVEVRYDETTACFGFWGIWPSGKGFISTYKFMGFATYSGWEIAGNKFENPNLMEA